MKKRGIETEKQKYRDEQKDRHRYAHRERVRERCIYTGDRAVQKTSGNPYLRERMSTIRLLVLTISDELFIILKLY